MKQHSTDNTPIPTAPTTQTMKLTAQSPQAKTTDETTAKTTDKISSKTTNDTLPLPLRFRRSPLILHRIAGLFGHRRRARRRGRMGLVSHGSAALTNPLHEIDAPAHYYFIRKILGDMPARLPTCGRTTNTIRRCSIRLQPA